MPAEDGGPFASGTRRRAAGSRSLAGTRTRSLTPRPARCSAAIRRKRLRSSSNHRGDLLANAGEPTAHESLPLAMICRQRGEDAEAREWCGRARRWRGLPPLPVSVTTELDALLDEAPRDLSTASGP
jgi:hypothetical protein